MCVCVRVCACVFLNDMYVNVYMYVCMYVYIYVCEYVYVVMCTMCLYAYMYATVDHQWHALKRDMAQLLRAEHRAW